MVGEKFTLMQYSVSAILGLIEAGQFVIPEIQRPFVWKRSQVRDLIDSLYNGYPTGYIITWKNPDVQTKDGTVAGGNQVANYTYLDTQANKAISDDAPCEYFGVILNQCESKDVQIGNITEENELKLNLAENAN